LGGLPPLAGAISKIFIFLVALGQGEALYAHGQGLTGGFLIALVVIALSNSIVSLVYYGRIVKVMYFDAPLKDERVVTPLTLSASIALMTAAVVVLTFVAGVILTLTSPAASSLLAFLAGR